MATTAELAVFAKVAYGDNATLPTGWIRLPTPAPTNNVGYDGAAFGHLDASGSLDQVVVAHRGTEPADLHDLANDGQLVSRTVPDQYAVAEQFLQDVQDAIPAGVLIQLTGHSLGGTIAELQGAATGLPTQTFNAYGARGLIPDFVQRYGDPTGRIAANDFSNIQNHQTLFDGVSRISGTSHLGDMTTLASWRPWFKQCTLESQLS